MRPRPVHLTALAFCLLAMARAAFAPAQGTSTAPSDATSLTQPGFLLRTQSRLVVLDVTVKEHGKPVRDLKQSDFKVSENGKRQRVFAFEEHTFQPQAAAKAALQLPEGEYSNIGIRHASIPAINIILFDALNSPLADQMYGRQQMVQFLKTLPPGQPTALFELSDVLKRLAGFSSNSDQLRAAAEKLMPHSSPWFVSEREGEQAAAWHNETLPPGPISTNPTSSPEGLLTGNALESFIEDARSWGLSTRLTETAAAFRTLAQMVAGYPGRKNILWLSEGFPLRFSPKEYPSDMGPVLARSAAGMLASEQVVVYPIDIRGLVLAEPTASTPNETTAVPGAAASLSDLMQQRLASTQQMMQGIAKDTGGEAFYNTNDLKNAFHRAIEDGSNFYSLAYVPSDRKWNGAYRKIEVKVDRGGFDLGYRRGYYATESRPSPAQVERDFESAMRPGIPDSTMVPFKIAVAPPGAASSELSITYDIRAENIAFQDASGGRKLAQIKFVAVAYGKDGESDGVVSQLGTLNLASDSYNRMLKSGIRFRQQLRIKPGDSDVRVGVVDENSGAFGTLNVPLPPAGAHTAE